MLVTKFDVAHYHHEYVPLSVNQTNNPEIPLHDICEAHVLSLVQFIRQYGFDYARGTLFVTNTAVANRFEESEGALSAISHGLDEAASVVLPDGRHRFQALHDLQKARNVSLVVAPLLVRCFTRHDSRQIAKRKCSS